MMAALAFEIEHGVHQMLDRLGPGDLAFLGDVAYQNKRRARGLGDSAPDRSVAVRTWAMVPGAASSDEVQMVWMESMATMPGAWRRFQRGENVFHAGGRT